MEKHFATFLSPGTFAHEETTKEVDSWDVTEAQRMSADVVERHGALPFGFYFTTRERQEDELDSKVTEKSPMYYLGGEILTFEDVEKRGASILLDNMKNNGIERVIENNNSWKITLPLEADDVVLDMPSA